MKKIRIEGNTGKSYLKFSFDYFIPNKCLKNISKMLKKFLKGAGKTTVINLIKKMNNPEWKVIEEDQEHQEYRMDAIYEDPKRLAFAMQVHAVTRAANIYDFETSSDQCHGIKVKIFERSTDSAR